MAANNIKQEMDLQDIRLIALYAKQTKVYWTQGYFQKRWRMEDSNGSTTAMVEQVASAMALTPSNISTRII